MTVLQRAIQEGQFNLAAHIIVLAAARAIRNGGCSRGRKTPPKLLLVSPR
jgi:hypothetical protein